MKAKLRQDSYSDDDKQLKGDSLDSEKRQKMDAANKDISKTGLIGPVKIASLIVYQKDSVVSRTLVDRKAGTVTLFSFDKGQGLSEHTAPFDVLVYVLEGATELTIARRTVALKAGEAIIIPSNKPHSLKAIDPFKMLLIMIHC